MRYLLPTAVCISPGDNAIKRNKYGAGAAPRTVAGEPRVASALAGGAHQPPLYRNRYRPLAAICRSEMRGRRLEEW